MGRCYQFEEQLAQSKTQPINGRGLPSPRVPPKGPTETQASTQSRPKPVSTRHPHLSHRKWDTRNPLASLPPGGANTPPKWDTIPQEERGGQTRGGPQSGGGCTLPVPSPICFMVVGGGFTHPLVFMVAHACSTELYCQSGESRPTVRATRSSPPPSFFRSGRVNHLASPSTVLSIL